MAGKPNNNMKVFRIEFATDRYAECDADGSSITLEFEKDMTFNKEDNEGRLVTFGFTDIQAAKQLGTEYSSRFPVDELEDIHTIWLLGFNANYADIKAVVGNVNHTPIIVVTLDTGDKIKVSWTGKAGKMKLYDKNKRNAMALDANTKAISVFDYCYNDVGGFLLYGDHLVTYPAKETFKIASVEGYEESKPKTRPATDGLDRDLEV